jgi:MSHA biogenesis protein MshJ
VKPYWTRFAARVDALTLRERVLAFAATAGVVVAIAWFAALGPMFIKYAALRAQIGQQQNNLAGLDGEMAQKIAEYQRDPDAPVREKLAQVQADSEKLGDSLRAMQKGLVAPERMAPLIDTILRANGRLKLVSMRTLPVSPLNEATPPEAAPAPEAGAKGAKPAPAEVLKGAVASTEVGKHLAAALAPKAEPAAPGAATVAPKAGSLLYRHGVEITVRGNYLDMIDYMNALETLPTQLFWGGAHLEVEDYPASRLTLTLYTLSLDSKWMKL